MARLTYAQKRDFGHTVAQFIREHATELKRAGFDPARKLAQLEANIRAATDLEVEQETLKVELGNMTEKAVDATKACYHNASSLVDTMVGCYGKKTNMAKRLRKVREEMSNVALRGKREPAS
jgi:hypothetical protein